MWQNFLLFSCPFYQILPKWSILIIVALLKGRIHKNDFQAKGTRGIHTFQLLMSRLKLSFKVLRCFLVVCHHSLFHCPWVLPFKSLILPLEQKQQVEEDFPWRFFWRVESGLTLKGRKNLRAGRLGVLQEESSKQRNWKRLLCQSFVESLVTPFSQTSTLADRQFFLSGQRNKFVSFKFQSSLSTWLCHNRL